MAHYRLKIALLALGVVLGYGSAFAHFSHRHDWAGHGHGYGHCHCRDGWCGGAAPGELEPPRSAKPVKPLQ